MLRAVINIVFFLSCTFHLFGQDASLEILKKSTESVFKNNHFQVNITYKMYKGHKAIEPNEITKGIYYVNGKYQYTKISEVEIVNTPSFYARINHNEKAVLLANGVEAPSITSLNMNEILNYVDAKIIKETVNYYRIELLSKQITQLPFERLVVDIDKKSNRMLRQLFYYFAEFNFAQQGQKSSNAKVKFEVLYNNYKESNFTINSKVFAKSSYILKDAAQAEEIVPSKSLEKYRVIDARKREAN